MVRYQRQEYAVYKGEELLVVGTASECAQELGVKEETIRWNATPTGRKRAQERKKQHKCRVVVRIEDD